jgi:predicted aspartyl protease
MRGCLVLPLVLGVSLASLGAVVDDRDSVRFRLHDSSDIVVAVNVGGQGPFRFLFDTGSNRSAVTERLAADLRLPRSGQTEIVTPAGRITRRLVHAGIGLAGVRTTVAAMVLPAADLGRGIDGIIGADFLAARRFTIDYIHRRVFLGAGTHREQGTSISLTHGADGFSVMVPVRDGKPPLRLIPDSGTSGFVLVAREGRSLPGITPLRAVPLRTIGGPKVGRAVLLEELHIGGIRVRDQVAVLMQGSSVDERLGDGLLPLHLFARVTFDAPGASLTLVPYK